MDQKIPDPKAAPRLPRYSTTSINAAPDYWRESCVSVLHDDWTIPICFAQGNPEHDPIYTAVAQKNWSNAIDFIMKIDVKTCDWVAQVLPTLHRLLVDQLLPADKCGWRTTMTMRMRAIGIMSDVQALAQVWTEEDIETYNGLLQDFAQYRKQHVGQASTRTRLFEEMLATRSLSTEEQTTMKKIAFLPCDAKQIPSLVQAWATQLQKDMASVTTPFDGFKLAVWTHHQLSAICPMAWQGNGRIARLISGRILLTYGFLPPVHNPKHAYMDAIVRGNGDLKYLLGYFADQIRQLHASLVDPSTQTLFPVVEYRKRVEQLLDTPIRPIINNKTQTKSQGKNRKKKK